MINEKKLPRDFYDRNTIEVAKDLLGKLLVHHVNGEKRVGKIVEVEAYLGPHDLAAHTSKGRTPRTEVMFGPPGHAYVYLIYGMYYCLNAVTEKEGHGSAVLLRALEPVLNIHGKTKGPGLLCNAMSITKTLNGHDLLSDTFYIMQDSDFTPISIEERPRIGVDYAKEWKDKPLRFYIKDNMYVSKK
ncbi:DNA-3-methyladenine glycosylase (plasmid) [Legionella adelaidensis]|uniref:Putative 3-methyladenine DNA glycosylase n=1 Tax=Legionella adelaidensis TaxID=45056 RepID=A0A0W0R3Z5_9GAMM|nr:DNA-3-methyladenine glycosylase [Legionella adelaidensis]KTC65796.1 3-methyladenine DNA glycosylase [Legionella adelaidensis]VEH85224.1 DNA-3-methyladenine glycosylase [Legionella adelaidensis]